MTDEQISELRRDIIDWTGGHREAAYAGTASGTILRALDERASLLEAAKALRGKMEVDMLSGDDTIGHVWTQLDDLDDALAKAEAP